MRGCTLEVYSEGLVVIESRFVWSWPAGWDILRKKWSSRKWRCWLWNRGNRDLCTLVLQVEEIFCRACLLCYCFLVTKVAFKSSLDLYFHPCITEFRIEENIHTKTVVDVSRGATERIFLFSWERLGGVSRSLLSLVKL